METDNESLPQEWEDMLNTIPPENILISVWVGSDDILSETLKEIHDYHMKDGAFYGENYDKPVESIRDSFLSKIEDISGNSLSIWVVENGRLKKIF